MKRWFGRIKSIYRISISTLLTGIALLFVRSWWLDIESSRAIASFLESIGGAFVVAAILAVTVDTALKTQLVRDAFKASFGYVLREELKPELSAMFEHRILCIRHDQDCELATQDQVVIMHMTLHRTFKNISDEPQELHIGLAVDEWFNTRGQSKIRSLGYTLNNKAEDLISDSKNIHTLQPRLENAVWVAEHGEVVLDTGSEIFVWCEFEETKQLNDVNYMFFRHPTIRPRVTVRIRDASKETSATINFAHRKASQKLRAGEHSEELPGTLLVHQPIEIRWWNEEQRTRLQELGRG